MSVIVKNSEGRYVLYCKGADSIIEPRCVDSDHRIATLKRLEEYSMEGLRTLLIAKKVIPDNVYNDWKVRYQKASTLIAGRKEAMEEL